jgi:hypothetical protein
MYPELNLSIGLIKQGAVLRSVEETGLKIN